MAQSVTEGVQDCRPPTGRAVVRVCRFRQGRREASQAPRGSPASSASAPVPTVSDPPPHPSLAAPLLPLQVAAVLWHQGEENAGNPVEYGCFFRSLVADWRAGFSDAGLPFAFVSLRKPPALP